MRHCGICLAIAGLVGCGPASHELQFLRGGTNTLFSGERGRGEYVREVEATTGEKLRRALRTGDPLEGETLHRMAIQLANLRGAEPPPALAAAVASRGGPAGRFLRMGARRYGFVLAQAAANPVAEPCAYAGPLLPGPEERYDPRELCWWRETFRQVGLPAD